MKIPLVIPYISVNVYVYVYNKNQGNIPKCLGKISTVETAYKVTGYKVNPDLR